MVRGMCMTKEERAELAVQYKQSGYNCCQSVIKAYEDCIPADESLLMQLGAGFAAGMGCMEATCGALTGAVMAAGVRRAGEMVPPVAKQILAEFKRTCGATVCKELKGIDTGVVLCPCDKCVRNAVLAAESVL